MCLDMYADIVLYFKSHANAVEKLNIEGYLYFVWVEQPKLCIP